MIVFIKGVFDEKRCADLSGILLESYKKNNLAFEGGNSHYSNSYGSSLREFNDLLAEMTPMIKEKSGYENISIKNSYSRIYFKDSILRKHKDRDGLDLTLSVCIYDDTDSSWPLHVEHDGSTKSIVTKVGDGALILGTKMNHWRDTLECAEGKMVMQCFFHWSIDGGNP